MLEDCPHCGRGIVYQEVNDRVCLCCGWRRTYHGWRADKAERAYLADCELVSLMHNISYLSIRVPRAGGILKW